MHEQPQPANQGKTHETGRHKIARRFAQQESKKVQHHTRIQLRFAMLARGKTVWLFPHTQRASRGQHYIEKNFKSFCRERWRQRVETVAAHHEKTTHRIAE